MQTIMMRQKSFLSNLIEQPVPTLVKRGDDAYLEEKFDDALHFYSRGLDRERKLDNSSTSVAFLLHKIGVVLARQGDSFAAMSSFEEALKIRQEKLGPGSQDAAETTAQMTKVLDDIRSQSGVGERQYVKGKSDAEDRSVVEHSLDIGSNLFEWGEYKEAEEVLRQCVENMDAKKESNDSEKFQALSTLAALDRAQGKYDEAKALYLEALKTAKKMGGESENVESSIVNSIAGYAEILRKAGDLWQAEALHKKVRGMLLKAKTLEDGGANSANIELQLAVSHTQLGCTVFELKKYKEALDEHQSALQIRLEMLDFNDALVSESFNYCAETLCALGHAVQALPLSMHAVDVRKKEFGSSHPAYAHTLSVLAQVYNSVGRSSDALPLIETCLSICESAFEKKNHANIVPNLLVYGDILSTLGDTQKALETFQRAEEIHKCNFKHGQKDAQLKSCQDKIEMTRKSIEEEESPQENESSNDKKEPLHCNHDRGKRGENAGNPVIVFTDVGKDVDDAIALVVLACLKRMFILNPIAVIATLSPQDERARLARVLLDSLGLPDVPVGIGTDGGSKDLVEMKCFANEQDLLNLVHGSVLIPRILREAEPKSVTLLCLANLKDVSQLIIKHPELFSSKIKNVVMMGGASYSSWCGRLEPDETAYNNNCDLAAARLVYLECQKMNIPTTTLSRSAAYDCPFAISKLDNLQLKCNHSLAAEIHETNTKAILTLWKKVNMPAWMPGRGRLPPRCDKDWFCRFFHVNIDDEAGPNATDSWLQSANIYLYDAFATLNCVDAYQELYFDPESHVINGTVHKLVERVAFKTGLVAEIDGFLHESFRLAMEGAFVKIMAETSTKRASIIEGDEMPSL